ncbi:MAG: peptidoglycan-binding protein [Candidatus Omnitrophica bacterium]|nr:peptidoglycan-binding protein [Candidatus Omnitrophota bacterium]
MFRRTFVALVALVVVVSLSGCATTKTAGTGTLPLDQKVSQMEDTLTKKDQEIKDLKYQVDDLNFQIQNLKGKSGIQMPSISVNGEGDKGAAGNILRVNVDPKDVQKALQAAGYYQGPIDGKIGHQSQKGIKSFQKDHGLTADGIIGQKTWVELKTYLQ